MAAKAVAPVAADLSNVWKRFQDLAEVHIREANIVAGERLWEIFRSPGVPDAAFRIQSVRRPANSVECSVDFNRRLLTCRCGPTLLAFHLSENPAAALEFEQRACTLDEALSLALDRLVRAEEADNQSAPGSRAE